MYDKNIGVYVRALSCGIVGSLPHLFIQELQPEPSAGTSCRELPYYLSIHTVSTSTDII